MSPNNTEVERQPMTIVPIWQGREWRMSLVDHPDGSVTLMRSGEADCGGSRSCPIPAEALTDVAGMLFGIAIKRAAAKMADALAAIIDMERRA